MVSQEAVAGYRHDGFLFPLPGIGAEAAAWYRGELEAFEGRVGQPISTRDERYKPYVRFPWADRLVREPAILDVVEQVIGPDILVWMTTFFIKEPGSEATTLWHQDWTFFGLRPHEHVTAWVALSEASEAAGCMRFVPGRGEARPLRHRPRADPNSINGGGQTVIDPVDEADAMPAALRCGEVSLHHTLCLHSSTANRTADRRIGIGISYIPAHVRHIGTVPVPAMLVRGEDRFGHFSPEPPASGHDATDAARHAESYRAYRTAYNEQLAWHEAGRTP